MARGDEVIFQIGDYVTMKKGTTEVTGQCMGFRVGQDGRAEELWIDGFYIGFDLGPNDDDWKVVDTDDGI